jgi:hypothetical protein
MGKMQVGIETQGWKFQENICSTFVIGERGHFLVVTSLGFKPFLV